MTTTEFTQSILSLCRIHNCSVTSWVRTPEHNTVVGGVEGSRHMIKNGGKAMDLVPSPNDSETREMLIIDGKSLGLVCIDETTHVHIHDNP